MKTIHSGKTMPLCFIVKKLNGIETSKQAVENFAKSLLKLLSSKRCCEVLLFVAGKRRMQKFVNNICLKDASLWKFLVKAKPTVRKLLPMDEILCHEGALNLVQALLKKHSQGTEDGSHQCAKSSAARVKSSLPSPTGSAQDLVLLVPQSCRP
jgi:hypothetical protein